MKLEFQNKWVRLLIEFFPLLPAICRYRVMPPALDVSTRRSLRRQIARRLRRSEQDTA